MQERRNKFASDIMPLLIAVIVVASAGLAAFGQKPDLVVSALAVDADGDGRFAGRVTVTVSNTCRGSDSSASFVLVTFKENAGAGSKAVYFVAGKVRPLKGGDSQTLTFDASASGKQIALDRHVIAEVDPYRKTAEVSETNNWRTLFPEAAGATLSQAQCAARK